tara:strand:+ start:2910 stop:3194 length:285 start_codon:yes stop_codon:yes gene_type:complete
MQFGFQKNYNALIPLYIIGLKIYQKYQTTIGLRLDLYLQTDMKFNKCPRCKKEVPESQYSKNQFKTNSYCKPCMSSYNKERNKIRKQRLKGFQW